MQPGGLGSTLTSDFLGHMFACLEIRAVEFVDGVGKGVESLNVSGRRRHCSARREGASIGRSQ